MSSVADSSTLVIGWGNDLRGDDGVGRRVAELVRARTLPGVEVLSLHQPGPELASAMAGRDRVIFVDASLDTDRVAVRRVDADQATGDGGLGHAMSPETLTGLAQTLYRAHPEVWAVHIPVAQFEFGRDVSECVQGYADDACERICQLALTPLAAMSGTA